VKYDIKEISNRIKSKKIKKIIFKYIFFVFIFLLFIINVIGIYQSFLLEDEEEMKDIFRILCI
jgi:ABC-type antimicrobial peptide transport system permease subunit